MAFAEKPKKGKGARAEKVEISDADFQAFWDAVQERVPYAGHVDTAGARGWLTQVVNDAPFGAHPVEWYVRRLGNGNGPLVGGSEIGILLSAERHLPAPFGKTPGILFDEKMLRRYQPSNIATRFGSERESQVADAFLEQVVPRGWARDTEGLSVLEAYAKSGGFKTLAYSPDDLFLLPDKRRFLIDYKTPYSGFVPEKEPFSYVAQLHQGKLVLEDQCGLPVDGMLLVYGEHPESMGKPESLKLHYFQVDFDPQLAADIPVAAQRFAQALMENARPCVLDPEAVEKLRSLDVEYVLLTAELKDLQERADGIKAGMSKIMESLSVTDITGAREETLSTLAASFKTEKPDALISMIQDVIPEVLEDAKTLAAWQKKGTLDLTKVQAYLEEQKVDLQPLMAPDTWDTGKIVKDSRVVASGVLDDAMAQGVVSRVISWRVPSGAEEKVKSLQLKNSKDDSTVMVYASHMVIEEATLGDALQEDQFLELEEEVEVLQQESQERLAQDEESVSSASHSADLMDA